jgi:hypothetical protein
VVFDLHGELAIGLRKEQDEQSGARTTIHALATKRAEIGRIYGVVFGGWGATMVPQTRRGKLARGDRDQFLGVFLAP